MKGCPQPIDGVLDIEVIDQFHRYNTFGYGVKINIDQSKNPQKDKKYSIALNLRSIRFVSNFKLTNFNSIFPTSLTNYKHTDYYSESPDFLPTHHFSNQKRTGNYQVWNVNYWNFYPNYVVFQSKLGTYQTDLNDENSFLLIAENQSTSDIRKLQPFSYCVLTH